MTVIAQLSKVFRHCFGPSAFAKVLSPLASADTSALVKTVFLSFVIVAFIVSPGVGEDFNYESHGKRDPFVPLVGIERPATLRLEDVISIGDVRLEGIASGPGGKLIAILNGEIVKEGDKFGEIGIGKINKKAVTIIMGGKNYIIDLAEEGGSKSGI